MGSPPNSSHRRDRISSRIDCRTASGSIAQPWQTSASSGSHTTLFANSFAPTSCENAPFFAPISSVRAIFPGESCGRSTPLRVFRLGALPAKAMSQILRCGLFSCAASDGAFCQADRPRRSPEARRQASACAGSRSAGIVADSGLRLVQSQNESLIADARRTKSVCRQRVGVEVDDVGEHAPYVSAASVCQTPRPSIGADTSTKGTIASKCSPPL